MATLPLKVKTQGIPDPFIIVDQQNFLVSQFFEDLHSSAFLRNLCSSVTARGMPPPSGQEKIFKFKGLVFWLGDFFLEERSDFEDFQKSIRNFSKEKS
jgi:hypothetical protein